MRSGVLQQGGVASLALSMVELIRHPRDRIRVAGRARGTIENKVADPKKRIHTRIIISLLTSAFIIMSSDLERKFKKAVWLIRNGPPAEGATTETKLLYYAHYKQATEGDVTGSQPWRAQFEARAKWDAWAKLKGMSREEAMQKYIDLISKCTRRLECVRQMHFGWKL